VGVSQGAQVEVPVGEPLSAPEGVPMGAPFPPPQYKFVQDNIAPQAAPHVIPKFVHKDTTNHQTDHSADHQVNDALPMTRPRHQKVGTWKDSPAKIRASPMENESYELHILLDNACDLPAAFITNHSHITVQPQPQHISECTLLECTLLQDPWENPTDYGYISMDSRDPKQMNDCDCWNTQGWGVHTQSTLT
jgi:hypothetical protein